MNVLPGDSRNGNAQTSIYFFCVPYRSAEESYYQHEIVCLAEGLRALGLPMFSNTDYWKDERGYLLAHDPKVAPDDCDIVVMSHAWFDAKLPTPSAFSRKTRAYRTVYLDSQDGSRLFSHDRSLAQFDLVLRAHFIDDSAHGSNFTPWAFGLSERIIGATAGGGPRGLRLLSNFRHNRSAHSVRLAVARDVMPELSKILEVDARVDSRTDAPNEADQLAWEQSGRRHLRKYFDRLRTSLACATFGGYFITAWPSSTATASSRALKTLLSKTGLHSRRVAQWDSWRLWEAFASASAVLHIEFDRYGCRLPVMPINWEHYVGFDLARPRDAIDRIAADPQSLEKIGEAGRTWAIRHYGPVPTAERFLKLAGFPALSY